MKKILNGTFVSAVVAMALLGSCMKTTQRGDARQTGPASKFGLLLLPEFPIGHTGVHTFEVRDLERPAFPSKVRILTKRSQPTGLPDYRDWEDTLFKVEVVSNGKVIRSHQFRPKRWRQLELGEFEHIFAPETKSTVGPLSYSVRVTVLDPSDREWDDARLVLR